MPSSPSSRAQPAGSSAWISRSIWKAQRSSSMSPCRPSTWRMTNGAPAGEKSMRRCHWWYARSSGGSDPSGGPHSARCDRWWWRDHCPSFFLNAPATTEIYTLSLHDALPISDEAVPVGAGEGVAVRHRVGDEGQAHRPADGAGGVAEAALGAQGGHAPQREDRQGHVEVEIGDRKSTRLNSSH